MIYTKELSSYSGKLLIESITYEQTSIIYSEGFVTIEFVNELSPEDILTVDQIISDHPLHVAKCNAKMDIDFQIEQKLLQGFPSDALGTTHYYKSTAEDQMNLIAVIAGGGDTFFSCSETIDGDKNFKLHTEAQMKIVFDDGKAVKLNALFQKVTIVSTIDSFLTIETLEDYLLTVSI